MPQVINTNISSLNAQRNLDQSSGGLSISLQRLSSGLRINSAKDDAAGLAIATRFTSRIQGLGQAQRNANDAISLAQVAEGALQETTRILQRSRELAIQSANGSNSSADRNALQAEVNQLKNELTRIATTTTFNGLNILNGDLQNATFQIGSEANQTVTLSISDTRTSALGSNQLKTSNTNGIEQATFRTIITGSRVAAGVAGIGSAIGAESTTAGQNGYVAETFTVSNTTTAGTLNQQTTSFANNDTADAIAGSLSGLTGVSATAFNRVVVSDLDVASGAATASSDSFSLNVSVSNGSGFDSAIDAGSTSDDTFAIMASNINADTDFASAGVYAIGTATSLEIIALDGSDIQIHGSTAYNAAFSTRSGLRDDLSSFNAQAAGTTQNYGGRVDVTLDQGYSLQSNLTAIFGGTAATDLTGQAAGHVNVSAGNIITAQTLTIAGTDGSTFVSIADNDEASALVTKINNVSAATGVSASAKTELTMQNLSADGSISFSLFGSNTAAAAITASVTTNDLTPLVNAINDASGATAITAATDGSNNVIKLTHATGKDIQILNFTHTSGVDFQAAASSGSQIVDGDGTSLSTAVEHYIDVVGNSAENPVVPPFGYMMVGVSRIGIQPLLGVR